MSELSYEERVDKVLSEFRSMSDEDLDGMRGIRRIRDFNGTLREFPSTGNVFQESESPYHKIRPFSYYYLKDGRYGASS